MGNAVKLGLGLLGSWGIALGIRIVLPRFLGPADFGILQFADGFTWVAFVVTNLGIETYVRKEVTTRPDHASEFFGGILLLGLLLGGVVLAVSLPALAAAGKAREILVPVALLGVAQILINLNAIFAALLHTVGKVDGLSVLNVASKLVWAVGIAFALWGGAGVPGVAAAMLVSEVVRSTILWRLSKRHAGLSFRVDTKATTAVLVASLPYFVGNASQVIYQRIDVSILSFLASDTEVGWYGAASTLAGLSLLMAPLIWWVLMPLTARAASRSNEEMLKVGRRAMEFIVTVAFPVSLFLWLGADVLIHLAFGSVYDPAVHSLRILAPTFLLTYLAMVSASLLVSFGRGWAVTGVGIVGTLVAPALSMTLVPIFAARFGDGGAGMGAATSLTITETCTALGMAYLVGRNAFDKRTLTVIGKTVLCGAVVACVDLLLPRAPWRLIPEGLLYVVLVVATGALDWRMLLGMAQSVLASRRRAANPTAADA
jgi:O-antigen/teichoic acid export membrane protein